MAKRSTKTKTSKVVQALEKSAYVPPVDVKPEDETDPIEADGLTIRQRRFVAAITGPAMGNATHAAELAGYSSDNRNALRVTACRLLTYSTIQQAIAAAFAKVSDSPEWARNAIIQIAQADMSNFLSVVDGKPVMDWEKAANAGAIGQIREYREEGVEDPNGSGKLLVVNKRSFKLHDSMKAREILLKLHGLMVEKMEHTGEGGGPLQVEKKTDLSGLSEDELLTVEGILAKAGQKRE